MRATEPFPRAWRHDSVVLVHDYLLVMRGAERTFAAIADCFPHAPIATLLYDEFGTHGRFSGRAVTTSFLQSVAADQRRFRHFLPVLPLAAERLRLGDARVVVSSSSAFAHGVRPPADAVHVCYCHSPLRYAWHEGERAHGEMPPWARPAGRAALAGVRRWDRRAAQRVTAYIANSELTRRRIAEFYGREAAVVYPPVDIDRFTLEPDPSDAFLMVGEITRHKNVEVALAAAERAGVRIQVVGDGPDLARLRQRFPDTEFLGRISDEALLARYAQCRALVVPAVEEFGITMVEAHASGRPVVAAARGGATEIVEDGVTGVLFPPDDVDVLADTLANVDWEAFDPHTLRANAERFSSDRFERRLKEEIAAALARAESATSHAVGDRFAGMESRPDLDEGAGARRASPVPFS
jgi:glycosyltransferase involved in cell wall biosynthesis